MLGVPKVKGSLSGALRASQGYSQESLFLSKSSREPIPAKFPNDFGKI